MFSGIGGMALFAILCVDCVSGRGVDERPSADLTWHFLPSAITAFNLSHLSGELRGRNFCPCMQCKCRLPFPQKREFVCQSAEFKSKRTDGGGHTFSAALTNFSPVQDYNFPIAHLLPRWRIRREMGSSLNACRSLYIVFNPAYMCPVRKPVLHWFTSVHSCKPLAKKKKKKERNGAKTNVSFK